MNVIESIEGLQVGSIFPNSIINADCLDAMKLLPDNSIDLICTDPPYFKVKNDSWDRQWDKPKEFLSWLDSIAEQWQRILKPNGSLYCFASPKMSARVEVMLGDRFNVVNRITWAKPCPFSTINMGASNSGLIGKEALRGYFPNTESIIFCEHYGADNISKGEAGYGAKCDESRRFVFEPLRAYLDGERIKTGATKGEMGLALALPPHGEALSNHFWRSGQFLLPKLEQYTKLQQSFPNHFTRPYEDLRLEYEELRRPFSVTADVSFTDVWTYPTVKSYHGKHPCEKPIAMLEHIITASSREGAIVLDSFGGSASTVLACLNTNRKYICIEKDTGYFKTSCDFVANHNSNVPVKVKKIKSKLRTKE